MLVLADESEKDRYDSIRRYGYAVQGNTPQSTLRIPTLAVIPCSRLVGFDTFTEVKTFFLTLSEAPSLQT